jgi:2'-5' RNA ligase
VGSEGIEKIRERLDPLAKKIPAHITLVFPEPAKAIPPEFLKEMAALGLPSLQSITFSHVHIHDEMYLWLLPDDEGKQKILAWREALVKGLTDKTPEHSQGLEEFTPHLTLGYIPRSLTPDDCLMFAKEFVTTPLTVTFEKILLEEFSENQISTQVDAISF